MFAVSQRTVQADDVGLAPSFKGLETILAESQIADEYSSRSGRLPVSLAPECHELGESDIRPLSFRLDEVCLLLKMNAAIDLLADQTKGTSRSEPEGEGQLV